MKKRFILILCLFLIAVMSCACGKKEEPKVLNLKDSTAKLGQNFLIKKGYNVIDFKGKSESYKVTYDKLLTFPYDVRWGVSKIDPLKYIGKTVDVYSFIVKNHPLDKLQGNSKQQTNVWLMLVDNSIVGGYSLPDDDVVAAGYSIDGKTIEKITGKDVETWGKEWKNYIKAAKG